MAQGCRIILTDDDADDRFFLAEALERNHFRGDLIEAGNGSELLSILKKQFIVDNVWPNIIVLDLNMPVLNGYQVLEQLKNYNCLPRLSVVVLTSSSKQEDEQWCIEAGCSKYYKKPFHIAGYDDIARDILVSIRQADNCC